MLNFEILGGPQGKARKKPRAEPLEHPNIKNYCAVQKDFLRKCSRRFSKFSKGFSKFSWVFRGFQTCSDPFGSIRTHRVAFGGIQKQLETLGLFRTILKLLGFESFFNDCGRIFLKKVFSRIDILPLWRTPWTAGYQTGPPWQTPMLRWQAPALWNRPHTAGFEI